MATLNAIKTSSPQLTLPVRSVCDRSFDNYFGASNLKAKNMLKNVIEDSLESFVFLAGNAETGKTHLLNALIGELLNRSLNVAYFDLKEIIESGIETEELLYFFKTLESYDYLALDNIDGFLELGKLDRSAKEKMLFNLFNFFKEREKKLIVASHMTPASLGCHIKDLESRLMSGLLVRLNDYDDDEKKLILVSLAKEKGLRFKDESVSFIIKRADRKLNKLIDILAILDRESLASQRKLTVPFIKKVLNW